MFLTNGCGDGIWQLPAADTHIHVTTGQNIGPLITKAY